MSRCKEKGGTLKEAVRAVFKFGVTGHRNEWYVEECVVCGKWHIKSEKQLKQ